MLKWPSLGDLSLPMAHVPTVKVLDGAGHNTTPVKRRTSANRCGEDPSFYHPVTQKDDNSHWGVKKRQ